MILDAKLEGLTFVIARVPEAFPRIGNTGVSYGRYEGDPPLTIYFTYNARTVTLLWIEQLGASDG